MEKGPQSPNTQNETNEAYERWKAAYPDLVNGVSEKPKESEFLPGETNIDTETGKERTWTLVDKYPRGADEDEDEYYARLRRIFDKEEEAQIAAEKEAAKKAYQNSEQGKKEAELTAAFDAFSDRMDQTVGNGLTAEQAERHKEEYLERTVKEIAGLQQDYKDRQTVGTKEEQDAYHAWLKKHDEENMENLERRGKQAASSNPDEAEPSTPPSPSGENPSSNAEPSTPPSSSGENPSANPEADSANSRPDSIDPRSAHMNNEIYYGDLNDNINLIQSAQAETNKPNDSTQSGDGDPGQKNRVEIKDIKLERLSDEIDKRKIERIKELEKEIDELRPDLAEAYAKNRRLFVGHKNKALFEKVSKAYGDKLNELMKLRAETKYEEGRKDLAENLENMIKHAEDEAKKELIEFIGDPESTERTQEEVDKKRDEIAAVAAAKIAEVYTRELGEIKTSVNVNFIKDYIKHQKDLEDATIDKLDNGTLCRKFVSKVLNNKYLKGAMTIAAAGALAGTAMVMIPALSAGIMSIGLSYTAGGVAAGAAKGALTGTLFSRQSSKNSAVRGFANRDDIINHLEGLDILDENSNTANVAGYLLDQYKEANTTDYKSNRKRTAISAGIGAAVGGLMSGIKISNITETKQTNYFEETGEKPVSRPYQTQEIVGYEPTTYETAVNLNEISHQKGTGLWTLLEEAGGNPGADYYQKANQVFLDVYEQYGIGPGQTYTYPGPFSEWYDQTAAEAAKTALNKLAEMGVIPSKAIAGGPIYDTVTKYATAIETDVIQSAATEKIKATSNNIVMNLLARIPGLAAIGVATNAISGRKNKIESSTETKDSAAAPDQESTSQSSNEAGGDTPTPETRSVTPERTKEEIRDELSVVYAGIFTPEDIDMIASSTEISDNDDEKHLEWLSSLSPSVRSELEYYVENRPDGLEKLKQLMALNQNRPAQAAA